MDLEKLVNQTVYFIDKIGVIHQAVVESVSTISGPEKYCLLRREVKDSPFLLGVPVNDIFLSEDDAYHEFCRRVKAS